MRQTLYFTQFNFRSIAVRFLAMLALALPGWADIEDTDYTEMSLEQLMAIPVRAASGFEQRMSAAPSAVTILTKQDIQNFGYRNLADAVSSASGFYVGYDRSYHYLGVRGFNRPGDYNTRTLVIINDIRVNDPLYSTGRVGGDFPLNLDLIDRIEIVRGPSSSLYGSSAFFAVINIITRDAQSVVPAEAALSAGSYQTFSGRFSFGKVYGEKGSLQLSGSLLSSEGDDLYFPFYDSPEDNNGKAEGLDGEKLGSLFLQAHYGNWTLQGTHMDRTKERPTASYGTLFNDSGAKDFDRETMLDLIWEGEFLKDWDGRILTGYQRYEYEGDWPYNVADEGEPPIRQIYRDEAAAETIGGDARVTIRAIPRHAITMGMDIRHAFRLKQKYGSVEEIILDRQDEQTDLGVDLQDEIEMTSWAIVNAGLRYDRLEPYGDEQVSPRTALILRPFDTSTLKLIYGGAFRAPNAYERFYNDGDASMKANPDLIPETIRTYEVVCEQKVTDHLHLNLSLYHDEINDLITQVMDPADSLLVFQNLEAAEAIGGEMEAIVDLPGNMRVRASYAYADAQNAEAGDRLSNSPEHMAKLNLLMPVIPHWLTAGVEVQYIGDLLTAQRTEVDGYTLANLTLLSRQVVRNLELSLSVYNLFDEDYAIPTGNEIEGGLVEQDGRTFRLKAMYQF